LSIFYEEKEKEIFDRQFLLIEALGIDSPLIFDVGANIGQSVDCYSKAKPESIIHCFEPNPYAFEKLVLHCKNRNHVKLVNSALSDRYGSTRFYATQRTELSSLLRPESWLSALSSDEKYKFDELFISCITLDQYCQDSGIEWIDILKIDVQGAEPKVLQGGAKLLSSNRIGLIYLEVMLADTYVNQATLVQLLETLGAYHYRLWDLVPFTYTHAGAAWTANALFICPQWAKKVEEQSRRSISENKSDQKQHNHDS
jgi:FkbM family methyltransferase